MNVKKTKSSKKIVLKITMSMTVPWYRWHISPSRSQSEGTRSVLLLERQLNVKPSALKEFVDGMYGLECSKTLLS